MSIDYSDERLSAHIEVHFETVRDNIKIARIIGQLGAEAITPEDETAAYLYYPCCVGVSDGLVTLAGQEPVSIRDLTFEQFMNLPGPLFTAWVAKVFEINPHFLKAPDSEVISNDGNKKKKAKSKNS